MTLSELLDALRSSPSLEALRQIPQPILIEWARGELGGDADWIHFVDFCSPGYDSSPGENIYFHLFGEIKSPWFSSSLLTLRSLGHLLSLLDSVLSLLSILRARQQQIEAQGTVEAWQAESEARLIEDVG